jgi:chemotaxis protein methyltransferase CheR
MEDASMVRLEAMISERTGLKLRPRQQELMRRHVLSRLATLGMLQFEPYQVFLEEDSPDSRAEWDRLVVPLLNKESYFFRDKGQMALLRDHILPELIEPNRATRTLRIWSAGCSTGEEAYSIAIIVHELLAETSGNHRWDVRIYGTDIDEQAIKAARRGMYGAWSFRMVDPEIRERFFKRETEGWQINEVVRQTVEFAQCNLVNDPFPSPQRSLDQMDLILCRNVFIYFRPNGVVKVLTKFARTLRDGGYLMTGHIETRETVPSPLRVRTFPASEVYQRDDTPTTATATNPGITPSVSRPQTWSNVVHPAVEKSPENVRSPKSEIHIEKPPTLPSKRERKPELILKAARSLADLGRYDEATEACMLHLKLFPLAYEPYELLSSIALEEGRDDDGKVFLKKAIYLSPSSPQLYIELGKLYQSERDETRAQKMFKSALDLLVEMPPDSHIGLDPAIDETATVADYIAHLREIGQDGG